METMAQLENDKILIVYFSWSGNAKALAGQIAEDTGGDLFEVKTATPYPADYKECDKVAKQEFESNSRPAILGSISNMEQYNRIFLCYPNWWGTLPRAVFTFLEAYDFSGKIIYPLITHGGSRFQNSLDDIRKVIPGAVISEGLDVNSFNDNPLEGPNVSIPNIDVTSWLNRKLS